AKTIDGTIDVFPPHQRQRIRVQISSVTEAVISQQLLHNAKEDGRVAAFEIMIATGAIRNLIRDDKIPQIDTSKQPGANHGMQTMDGDLLNLYHRGMISKTMAISHAIDQVEIKKHLI